jgi:hypothetical protein
MHYHEALTVHQIGGHLTHQVVLKDDTTILWTSPIFLDESSARDTVSYLRQAVDYGECSQCWANPYILTDVVSEDATTEPDLVFLCRECNRETMAEIDQLNRVGL